VNNANDGAVQKALSFLLSQEVFEKMILIIRWLRVKPTMIKWLFCAL